MEKNRRRRHRKKKYKESDKRILTRIKRFFKNLFVTEAAPKEYRPYLGPGASKELVEEKRFENTRVNLKKYSRQRRRKPYNQEGLLGRKWYQFMQGKRKKKKHKRRSGSLHHHSGNQVTT